MSREEYDLASNYDQGDAGADFGDLSDEAYEREEARGDALHDADKERLSPATPEQQLEEAERHMNRLRRHVNRLRTLVRLHELARELGVKLP